MDRISYANIYYDRWNNKIHLWEIVNDKTQHLTFEHDIVYYEDDIEGKSDITDPLGNRVVRRTTKSYDKIKSLKSSGIKLYESDIKEEIKFLQNRYQGQELKPFIHDYNICYLDIEIQSEGEFPNPHEAKFPINLITIKLSKTDKTHTFALKRPIQRRDLDYTYYESEKEMLEAFIKFFRRSKVDIISGWNVSFDLNSIINRCEKLGGTLKLSPINKYYKNYKTNDWSIIGVTVYDYMGFFKDPKYVQEKKESYSLQYIAMDELGEGKLEYEGQINEFYKKEWDKFVDYNIQDVLLVEKLEKKLKFIELAVTISHTSLIPLDCANSAVLIIEGQLLALFHSRNQVMNDRKEDTIHAEIPGAYVESFPGFYKNSLSYDFDALYPTIMTMFMVSPDNLILNPSNTEGLIKTPISESHGIYYKNNMGFLTEIILKLKTERKNLKDLQKKAKQKKNIALAQYYDIHQNIRKRIVNSAYGACLSPFFHYYSAELGTTVTLTGQDLIKYMKRNITKYFDEYYFKDKNMKVPKVEKRTCLLDTDSLFLCFDDVKENVYKDSGIEWVNKFHEATMKPLIDKILNHYFSKYNMNNAMNFKLEKTIESIAVFGKKNYACKVLANEGIIYDEPEMKVTGFASKRSSTPKFCRAKIDVLLNFLFENQDKDKFLEKIREIRNEFETAPIEDIAFPKGISDYNKYKDTEGIEYSEKLKFQHHTPIHNRAGILYNHMIKKYQLSLEPVSNGSKIKYVYVDNRNELEEDVIGFMGQFPPSFKEKFKVDYKKMFDVGFLNACQTIFDTMGWGIINLDYVDVDSFFA